VAAVALLYSWAGIASSAPKTDILEFTNGDHLTGEFKGLDRGRLQFNTDATDTISIEWDKIASLETNQVLEVELISGFRFFGQTRRAVSGSMLVVSSGETAGRDVKLADIVRMDPLDQGNLVERLDGYVTAGYDYTKASRLQQFTFTGGINMRSERREMSLDASMTATSESDADDTHRYNVTGNYRHLLPERRFYQGFATLDGNDELGLDLRTTLGGGYGTYLVQDGRREWTAFAGLALNREQFETGDERESLEAVLGTTFSYFRYDTPKANVDVSWFVLPSLTESGRLRSEASLKSRYEIISDLFFEISVYGSYDNQPDEEAESDSDYGITTSLGYSF